MIHDGVLDTEPRTSVNSVLYRLRNFVQGNMKGKQNAMKSGAIMHSMGFHAGGTNQKLRAAAKLLLREEKIPLISGPSGFYVAQTIDELVEYERNLESRKRGIQESQDAVREIRDRWMKRPKSGELFGEDG